MEKELQGKKKKIVLSIFLFGILLTSILFINLISSQSYARSVVGYTPYVGVQYSTGDTYFPWVYGADGNFNRNLCEAGQDFILYVSPTGCIPSVVRSDLLEEQNVPVFCPIMATKLNPLVDVEAIDYVSFRGNTPKEVSGLGYYPAQAALGKVGLQTTSSLANTIGYAVIVLRQQKNESAMPEFVEGNITAMIKYDVKNAFGVGQASFYLNEMSDSEWNENFKRYGFWQGRGYLRVDSVEDNRAVISIYSDRDTYSMAKTEKRVVATVPIEVGKTSREILMPGFDYCMGALQLQLHSVENPGTMAKLNINGDYIDLKKGEKFIDDKCYIRDIDKRGVAETVSITCREDTKTNTFSLTINPKIVLSIGGVEKNYSIGDKLYEEIEDGKVRGIYLVYARTNKDSRKGEDLTITIVAIEGTEEKLSDARVVSMGKFLNRYPDPEKSDKEEGLANKIKNIFITGISEIERIFIRGLVQGQAFRNINVSQLETKHFEKNIKVIGFAGAINVDISQYAPEFREYYTNAMRDYEKILESYNSEKYPQEDSITLGQKTLTEIINLAKKTNQMRDVLELCKDFEQKYPNIDAPDVCQDDTQISSLDFSAKDVEISGKIYSISMVRIQEPSFDDLGVTVDIGGTSADFIGSRDMGLNDRVEINTSEYITLVGVERDYAIFDISGITRTTTASTVRINLNSYEVVGSHNYRIGVTKINLNKVAKVSVKPNIKRETTNATFSFKIGIEKRAIQLTPEKTKERIEKLNKTIARWENINEKLGTVVRTGKAACLATSTALTVKYFFANLRGEGIAREMVMRESGGWLEFCETEKIRTGKSVSDCLLANSPEIDANVNEITQIIQEQNKKYKELQQGITKKTDFLGEDVVDTGALMKRLVDADPQFKNDLNSISDKVQVNVSGKTIAANEIINKINSETITLAQAKEIQLNAQLLNSGDSRIREIAKKNLEASLGDVWVNNQETLQASTFQDKLPQALKNLGVSIYAGKESVTEVYNGGVTTGIVGEIPNNVPAQSLIYKGKEYILQLEKAGENYRVKEIYDINGNKIDSKSQDYNQIQSIFIFKQFDRTTYQNPSTTMVLRYYESGNYQGVPAIIPFDTANGWYAAVKPSVSLGGSIKAVDDSGRVSSFWLCNVGANKKEEFFETTDFGRGDDICRMINRVTGEPYDQFPGREPSEALELVNNAQIAISQAQRAYKASGMSSKINILGKPISVGEPAYGVPDLQCQDFMSPKDCNLMFNICDPFVCPSSRCNLGGAHTVKDVIQSGIAGSIALCLPNFPEVVVPICVSGVHAGIDGYLSVMKSYQECLGTSLQTGQTVGVCDYLHSIYMCEFFWKQSLPVAKYAIPKLINKLVGQSVRGGGEYLGAKDAWERAGQSVDYFTQYYAANSYKAFKARSLEGVGTEFCKNWLSIPGLGDGKLFDALISPDSPFQFYGSFQEIPFTTATVPPISHYKVFYHVYAGKDLPAYYEVYIKGDVGSYYQDISSRRLVARGFIAAGERASNTEDFTAPSGYKELCIVVNNQEECGFKQVSTDFAVQYISDSYVSQQAKQTNITSANTCISGTSNLLSLLNPNLEAGATDLLNPAIYNVGLVRICATDDPGKTTDPYAGTEKARWQEVGYCDTPAVKCWLDTKSVKNSIDIGTIENKTLSEVSDNYLENLMTKLGSVENFDELVKEIDSERDSLKQIEKINENFNKVYLMYQKGHLLFLRGNAFSSIAKIVFDEGSAKKLAEENKSKDDESTYPQITIPTDRTDTTSIEIISPIFEYKSGGFLGGFKRNVFYMYSEDNWYFSLTGEQNAEEWFSIDKNLEEYGKLSKTNQELTLQLIGKLHVEGLKLLIDKTIQNKDGGLLSNVELSTKRIEFSPSKRFTFKAYEPLTFYFEYDSSSQKWKWSDDKKRWFSVSERIDYTATLVLAYETYPREQVRLSMDKFGGLIATLDGKSFYEGATIIFQEDVTGFSLKSSTCRDKEGCQKILGREIIRVAKEEGKGAYDGFISSEIGVKNFECLVLMVAYQESKIQHCDSLHQNGNPLYCNRNIDELIRALGGNERSFGVMQINIDAHPGVNVAEFLENVRYGVRILTNNYEAYKNTPRTYLPTSTSYSGWRAALRAYNGWGTGGDSRYVENVLGDANRNAIANLFPECSTGVTVSDPRQKVLETIKTLEGTLSTKQVVIPDMDKDGSINCWDSVHYIYYKAGVNWNCIYSDQLNKKYTYNGKEIFMGVTKNNDRAIIFQIAESCTYRGLPETSKLDLLKGGEILSIVFDEDSPHNVIFVDWVNYYEGKARIFDWAAFTGKGVFEYGEINIKDNQHSVYRIWKPI